MHNISCCSCAQNLQRSSTLFIINGKIFTMASKILYDLSLPLSLDFISFFLTLTQAHHIPCSSHTPSMLLPRTTALFSIDSYKLLSLQRNTKNKQKLLKPTMSKLWKTLKGYSNQVNAKLRKKQLESVRKALWLFYLLLPPPTPCFNGSLKKLKSTACILRVRLSYLVLGRKQSRPY